MNYARFSEMMSSKGNCNVHKSNTSYVALAKAFQLLNCAVSVKIPNFSTGYNEVRL